MISFLENFIPSTLQVFPTLLICYNSRKIQPQRLYAIAFFRISHGYLFMLLLDSLCSSSSLDHGFVVPFFRPLHKNIFIIIHMIISLHKSWGKHTKGVIIGLVVITKFSKLQAIAINLHLTEI